MEKIKRWNKWHAIALLSSLLGIVWQQELLYLSLIATVSFSYFIYFHLELIKRYRPLGGYAFWLTLFRLIILLSLGWSFRELSDQQIFLWTTVAMLADGIDGWLARRFQTASEFGAYFDMESDAFFVCIISGILYLKGYCGFWILGIGYLRYIYVGVLYLFRQDRKKEPANRWASIIAGFLFLSLLTPFILDESIYMPIVTLASILVTGSFSYSFVKLLAQE